MSDFRKEYEMSQEQLDKLLDASKPTRVMKIAGQWGATQQENANSAWANLGRELGFDYLTVKPSGKGDKFFSAVSLRENEE